MGRFYLIGFLTCFLTMTVYGQKSITLEDIYTLGTFRTGGVRGFDFTPDGHNYIKTENDKVKEFDFTTGQESKILLDLGALAGFKGFNGSADNFSIGSDNSTYLIESETTPIYRYSSKVKAFIFNDNTKSFDPIFEKGKISNPQLSPDATMVAFTYENNLYIYHIKTKQLTQVTFDGKANHIINGMSDWVYEEEFGFTRAFYWAPDSKKIAFLRFDETEVPEFSMQYFYGDMYPFTSTFKYPKVGEKNANVSAHMYALSSGRPYVIDIGDLNDMYIPRAKWTAENHLLCIYKMNRHQNKLTLYLHNTKENQSAIMLQEESPYYIDITDDLTFLEDKRHYIWSSEKEGFNQLYLHDMQGKSALKLTTRNADVTNFYGYNAQNQSLYYQAIGHHPREKNIYTVSIKGGEETQINNTIGDNRAQFSSDMQYFMHIHSTANTPPIYTIKNIAGVTIRTLSDNAGYTQLQEEFGTSPLEFFGFTTSEGVSLNGWMIKPKNFSSSKKYPVFMTQYSGPGSQQVTDAWKGSSYWWYQMIAQSGYIVVCVDGRGTGGRGEDFKKMTYLQLGHYETIDQIETAKFLGYQPYIDKNRIGIYGWSYGGFMSSLCILKGNDVFKAAIAIAPVTSWKWYDTVYTERYMRTLLENEKGYTDNSPIYFADRLKGSYLLVHGMTDDNVHFQHTAEMANALIKANKQFDTYFYPNRNHGIYGNNATLHLYTKMTNFIYEKI